MDIEKLYQANKSLYTESSSSLKTTSSAPVKSEESKEVIEDKRKKLVMALAGLACAAIAGFAIYKHTGKTNPLAQDSKGAGARDKLLERISKTLSGDEIDETIRQADNLTNSELAIFRQVNNENMSDIQRARLRGIVGVRKAKFDELIEKSEEEFGKILEGVKNETPAQADIIDNVLNYRKLIASSEGMTRTEFDKAAQGIWDTRKSVEKLNEIRQNKAYMLDEIKFIQCRDGMYRAFLKNNYIYKPENTFAVDETKVVEAILPDKNKALIAFDNGRISDATIYDENNNLKFVKKYVYQEGSGRIESVTKHEPNGKDTVVFDEVISISCYRAAREYLKVMKNPNTTYEDILKLYKKSYLSERQYINLKEILDEKELQYAQLLDLPKDELVKRLEDLKAYDISDEAAFLKRACEFRDYLNDDNSTRSKLERQIAQYKNKVLFFTKKEEEMLEATRSSKPYVFKELGCMKPDSRLPYMVVNGRPLTAVVQTPFHNGEKVVVNYKNGYINDFMLQDSNAEVKRHFYIKYKRGNGRLGDGNLPVMVGSVIEKGKKEVKGSENIIKVIKNPDKNTGARLLKVVGTASKERVSSVEQAAPQIRKTAKKVPKSAAKPSGNIKMQSVPQDVKEQKDFTILGALSDIAGKFSKKS